MKIAGFCQERSACTTLRTKHPLEKIRALGLAEVNIITDASPNNVVSAIKASDVVVLGRASSQNILDMIVTMNQWGKKVVFDLDDNLFEVSVLSPHYKDFGTMAVDFEGEDGSKSSVWKQGVNGFDAKVNRNRRAFFMDIVRVADCISVTTPPLEMAYRRFNDNVRILPNSIDFNIWGTPPLRWGKEEVRLLYTGATNHQEDWTFVAPVLAQLQKKYPQLKIVLVGPDWKYIDAGIDYSRVEHHGWIDFEAYPYLLKSLCCDIGIAPISKITFNDSRSSLKWLEYSALSMATVATQYGPYRRDVEDGRTGLLVRERDEWAQALSRLIEDKAYRKQLGMDAYAHCKRHYDLNYTVDLIVATYQRLLGVN